METRVLEPIATTRETNQRSIPALEPAAGAYGFRYHGRRTPSSSTCKIDKKKNARLWKNVELLLVNNEVAPLEEMNFLGLLVQSQGRSGHAIHG